MSTRVNQFLSAATASIVNAPTGSRELVVVPTPQSLAADIPAAQRE